jgi:SsrA-binding protein
MSGVKVIVENKKARFDFHILETIEAGLVLTGSEVKSIRNAQVTLKDSYISFRGEEAFLQNAHISEYKASSYNNHEPERLRKLLLHKNELEDLQSSIREKGLSCIPLKVYLKRGKIKLLLGLAKGKKKGDKREDLKKRDANREIDRQLRRSK